MTTALVIDGAYFLRRCKRALPNHQTDDPKGVAAAVEWLGFWHLAHRTHSPAYLPVKWEKGCRPAESSDLYRIFFYDCPPLTKKVHMPVSGRPLDLAKTESALLRMRVHDELSKVRKVALRLGRLRDSSEWRLKSAAVKRLTSGNLDPLSDDDFELDTKQKGVDMKLGLDVAAMAFKRQVDQIVLVAGDADFVPATKLARREGIDVVLDPMGWKPAPDLLQHVDGVRDSQQARNVLP